jgi:SAM-dependent methyltransferase
MEKKEKFTVPNKACQILSKSRVSNYSTSASEPFRILSIGCGNGTFDTIVLQSMMSQHPDIKLDYTGIDIDEVTCQKAREELGTLKKTSDKIEIRILKMDMHSLTSDIPASCDLILAMHSLYYAVDLRKVLSDVQALLKTDGKCLFLMVPIASDN